MNIRNRIKDRIHRINRHIVNIRKLETRDSEPAMDKLNDLIDLRNLLCDCLDEIPVHFEPAPPEHTWISS